MDGKKVMFNKFGMVILFIVSLALSMGMVSANDASLGDVTNISVVNSSVYVSSSNLSNDSVKVKSQKVYSVVEDDFKVYVAVNGSDENGDGTLDNPYESLNSAINHAVNGSTIYMFNGTYRGLNNTNLVIDKTLIISAWNGAVTLDGEDKSQLFDITIDGNLTLNGLKIINGCVNEESTSGAVLNYGDLTILNSTFSNNNGFLAGAILNYGNLTVSNSTFKTNKGTNYAGGIANFGTTYIQNSQFTQNTDLGLFNVGNVTVNSSNFDSNSIGCDNFGNNKNSVTLINTSFEDAGLTSKFSTIYIYNSSFSGSFCPVYLENSNATIIGSIFNRSAAYVGPGSMLNISYSIIMGSIDVNQGSAYASYNWWGSNMKPNLNSNVVIDNWVILTFISEENPIPSKTNVTVKAVFKCTDGKSILDLGNDVYLPPRFVSFETDNGFFSSPKGYMVNNSFSTNYMNNTDDTLIYVSMDNQKLRLVIGTGGTDYSIYVSNDGNDYYGDGSKNNPYKTLQKAVGKALNGNKIYIFAGNYAGLYNSGLYINKNLTFSSFNGDVFIYRYSDLQIFNITEFGQLNLNNINIYSEMSYAVPLIKNNGVLVLNNCTVANSKGGIEGGAISIYHSKFYSLTGQITSNILIIVNSSFDNIYVPSIADDSDMSDDDFIEAWDNLTVINSTFSNSSSYLAGKFFIKSGGALKVLNSTFINNNNLQAIRASVGDGSSSSVLISGSTFINNMGGFLSSRSNSGEIIVENCTFINTGRCVSGADLIKYSLFINNTAGGPIVLSMYPYSYPGHWNIFNSTFINNFDIGESYESYGANGVVFNGGNLTVTQCTFLNNFAGYGGAIYNTGDLNVSYSAFVNNTAKYLAADVYNRMGTAYLLFNWWGSNSGPTGEKVYRFLGDIYAYNWVIMTLTLKGNILNASLNKITDSNGNMQNLGGILPSREVFFDSAYVNISPKKGDLVNNSALAMIMSSSDKDFVVNAVIDNQSLDLTVRNNSTIIDVDNVDLYGNGNIYGIVLRNVNGYLMSDQTLKVIITDQKGKLDVYSLITDKNGKASLIINNIVGVYNMGVIYGGDGYFEGSQANATIRILTAITKIVSYDATFYGKENIFYVTLYDFMGRSLADQKITFNISHGNESKVYYGVTDAQGRAGVAAGFVLGKYNVKASFAGNGWYGSSSSASSFTIYSTNTVLTLGASVLYGRGNPYIVNLRDGKGNVIRNVTVSLMISKDNQSETFNIKTNENGTAGIMINLYPGLYNVTAKYNGNSLYGSSSVNGNLTISKVDTKLRATSFISNFNNIYEVTLTDIYNRPLVGEFVNITVINSNFKTTYSAVTDSKGVARLVVILNIGNYVVVDNFYTNSWYGSTTTASTLMVSNVSVNNFFVYDYLTNAQIQYILNNCKDNGNVIFSKGQYNNLKLIVSKPVNIKNEGPVIIFSNGSGTAFTITSNVTIQGLTIKNYAIAILNKVNNVSVVNNTFAGDVYGFVNYGSGSGVKIGTNNVFQSNKGSAIYNYGNNLTFKGFKLVNNKVGITNKGSNVDMLYNTISGGEYGIINYQKSADINYNTISGASKSGIYNAGSSSKIGHNTLKNDYYGVYNKGSSSIVSYNAISGGNDGIVNSASSVMISGNTVKSVKICGIYSSGSSVKIYKNTLTGLNKGYGIHLISSAKSNLVQSNIVSKFSYGLFDAGYKNTLQSNTLKYNKVGLDLYKTAKYSTVIYNKVYKNTSYGVYNRGYKTTLYKNQITYNTKYGLGTVKSVKNTKNTIRGNKVNTRLIK